MRFLAKLSSGDGGDNFSLPHHSAKKSFFIIADLSGSEQKDSL